MEYVDRSAKARWLPARVSTKTAMGVLLAAALAIAALGPAAGHARAAIGIHSFSVTQSDTQAGGHPDIGAAINFCPPPHDGPGVSSCLPSPSGANERLKRMKLELPDGLLAAPLSISTCPDTQFEADTCPLATELGTTASSAETFLGRASLTGSIYNLDRNGSATGRLGFILRSTSPFIPTLSFIGSLGSQSNELTFGGDFPGTAAGIPMKIRLLSISVHGFAGAPSTPFVTAPTSCAPSAIAIAANSFEDATFVNASAPMTWSDCDDVPFQPTSSVALQTSKAGVPSGYTFEFDMPAGELPTRQSHVRRTKIELPVGTTLAPASVGSLQACTDAQLGTTGLPANCPAASQTGALEMDTPLIDGDPSDPDRDPVEGSVYFGTPTAGDPYRLFLVVEVDDVGLKMTGSMHVDEGTGQVDVTLDDQPQVPFSKLKLRLDQNGHLLLQNPRECGNYQVKSTLTPWNGGPDVVLVDGFQITGDGAGGPCAPRAFSPTVHGTTDTTQARARPSYKLTIERPAGQQYLQEAHVVFPRGLVGSLAAVPLCPADQVTAGTCDLQSRIGGVGVELGDGDSSLHVDGNLYLGEPLVASDAASLSFAVPAKAGPLDLGTFVTTSRVALRGGDVPDVIPSKLPTAFKGVPLSIRKIEIGIDRPGFMVNPSSCLPKQLEATFTSDEGGAATAADPFQVTGCDQLAFAPKMQMFAGPGNTAARSHPPLRAIVTQDPNEAAIDNTRVLLAEVLRPNVPVIQTKMCPLALFETYSCPPSYRVGRMFVETPLVPRRITGGLFLVKHPGVVLPTLGAISEGSPAVRVEGPNAIKGVQVENKFEGLPDVPLSRVEFHFDGGNGGLLNAFRDLCDGSHVTETQLTGQNGKTVATKVPLQVQGCGPPGLRILGRRVKVTRKGIAPIKVQCAGAQQCSGRLTIARAGGKGKKSAKSLGGKRYRVKAGSKATLKVKLNKRTLKKIRSKGKLRARISTSRTRVSSKPPPATVTLTAARKKVR